MEEAEELRELTRQFYESANTGNLSFVERHVSRLEDAVFLGTDPREWWEGIDVLREVLRSQAEEWGGLQMLPARTSRAYREGTVGWVIERDASFRLSDGTEVPFRGTSIFHREEGEWKLVHGHASLGVWNEESMHPGWVAHHIQQASLPKELPELEGWQIAPYYQPAREVGGDFYDLFDLEEGRVGVVVGDATGKGVPAALMVSAASSMLRAVAQALGPYSPGEVLQRVNETLFARIPPNMFVTCFYAILNPRSGDLLYANAVHDLPYLRRRRGECVELRARGMPLGLMPGMSYEEKEIELDAGEVALFYSDGLVEAHDPEDEMFGFPRLQALVSEHAAEERSLKETLLEELYSFVGEGWEQEDDITLLTLRCSPP